MWKEIHYQIKMSLVKIWLNNVVKKTYSSAVVIANSIRSKSFPSLTPKINKHKKHATLYDMC